MNRHIMKMHTYIYNEYREGRWGGGATWSWKKTSMACERTASCVIKTSSFSPVASDLMCTELSCHADASRSCNICGRVSVLQCVAVRCSVLQCVIVCRSVLHRT